MDAASDTMNNKAKRLLEHEAALGAKVDSVVQSEGYQILLALFQNRVREIKDKEDYASVEDFKADRKALKLVRDLFNEFEDMINDADLAAKQLKQLIEDNPATPSPLIIEDEGTE